VTIYLDYAATTPVDPRVAAVMSEWLAAPSEQGNPASVTHWMGLAANDRIEEARGRVAALIVAAPREVIFTSGATESNNLALLGVAAAAKRARPAGGVRGHFISSRVEHRSVLDPLQQIAREGFDVTLLEPDEQGRIPPEAVRSALRDDTLLVSLMLANNEIGVLNDIAGIRRIAAGHPFLLHTDASQAAGKVPFDVTSLGVDLLSFTAHKFHGPKGIGALYVREAVRPRIAPIQFGGGHERGLRSGTLPTHQIVGFGVAAALGVEQLVRDAAHARDLALRLCQGLEAIPRIELNSQLERGLPGLVNASFPGVEGESLVTGLSGISVSTGSACSSATREASYVLRALGRDSELAQSSLRISFGRFTTATDIDAAATAIRAEVARLRAIAGDVAGQPEGAGTGTGAPPPRASLLVRTLNGKAQRYFLAAPRPARFAPGSAPQGFRHGHAGRQQQGTAVLFELEVADSKTGADGTVKSARFNAYGCPHTLAVAAWLCEVVAGTRLDAGIPGGPADWAGEFAVPVEKLGRLLIVEDALRAAYAA
jgi:cysteine desulfurase